MSIQWSVELCVHRSVGLLAVVVKQMVRFVVNPFLFEGEGGDNEGEFYFELVVIESLVDYVWHRQKRSNQLVVLHFQQSGSVE